MAKRPTPRGMRKALDAMEVPEVFREREAVLAKRHPGGRPPVYSRAIYDEVLARVAAGEFFSELERDPRYPAAGYLREKTQKDPEFAAAYARARVAQAHAHAERAVMEARAATPETAFSARLKYDAEKWMAAKLDPANYGDKVDLTHRGTIGVVGIPYDPDTVEPEDREVLQRLLLKPPPTIEHEEE